MFFLEARERGKGGRLQFGAVGVRLSQPAFAAAIWWCSSSVGPFCSPYPPYPPSSTVLLLQLLRFTKEGKSKQLEVALLELMCFCWHVLFVAPVAQGLYSSLSPAL